MEFIEVSLLDKIKDFIWWYKHLTSQGYGYIISIDYAFYNCRNYDRTGKNR
jgi:hypothetical protein